MAELTPEEIQDLARRPAQAVVDGVTVQERAAQDLKELDQYQAAKQLARDPMKALRQYKVSMPGL